MSWDDAAACRPKRYPEAWFPVARKDAEPAREVCLAECPIREACAQYAYDHGENWGVWGGFALPWERAKLRRFLGYEVPVRPGLVRADEVRLHISALNEVATLAEIAEAADVKLPGLKLISSGVQEHVTATLAERLLAVTAEAVSA